MVLLGTGTKPGVVDIALCMSFFVKSYPVRCQTSTTHLQWKTPHLVVSGTGLYSSDRLHKSANAINSRNMTHNAQLATTLCHPCIWSDVFKTKKIDKFSFG